MKKFKTLLLALAFSFSASWAYAWYEMRDVNTSSFTLSNDATSYISLSSAPWTMLSGVVVSGGDGDVIVKLFDSTWTAANQIGSIRTGATPMTPTYVPFNVRLLYGLTYTIWGNTHGVTILYKR